MFCEQNYCKKCTCPASYYKHKKDAGKSCRVHNLNDKGYCKDCHRHKSKLTNCYHKWVITNQCIIL